MQSIPSGTIRICDNKNEKYVMCTYYYDKAKKPHTSNFIYPLLIYQIKILNKLFNVKNHYGIGTM